MTAYPELLYSAKLSSKSQQASDLPEIDLWAPRPTQFTAIADTKQ